MNRASLCSIPIEDIRAEHFDPALRERGSQLFETVLQQSQDCVKLISPDGRLDFMSVNGLCAMEIDDFAIAEGSFWWELWPSEAQDMVRSAVERACAGQRAEFEAFCPTAKGNPRWWQVRVSPIHDGDGQVSALLSVSRDISHRFPAA